MNKTGHENSYIRGELNSKANAHLSYSCEFRVMWTGSESRVKGLSKLEIG